MPDPKKYCYFLIIPAIVLVAIVSWHYHEQASQQEAAEQIQQQAAKSWFGSGTQQLSNPDDAQTYGTIKPPQ